MNLDGLPPVGGLDESSLVAWEGRTAAVVHLQGCNLACPSCAVPHLIPSAAAGPGGALRGRIPVEAVLDAVFARRALLDGVVITGGEPLLHETLPDLLEILRSFGLDTRVVTNGTRPRLLARLLNADLVDSVAVVLRAPLGPLASLAAGGALDLGAVYRSLERVVEAGGEHEVRIVVDPRILTRDDVVRAARAAFGVRRLVLEPVVPGRPGMRVLTALARDAGPNADVCIVAGRPGRDYGRNARPGRVGAA